MQAWNNITTIQYISTQQRTWFWFSSLTVVGACDHIIQPLSRMAPPWRQAAFCSSSGHTVFFLCIFLFFCENTDFWNIFLCWLGCCAAGGTSASNSGNFSHLLWCITMTTGKSLTCWSSLNHFFPWSSWEEWDHWQIKWTSLEPWWGHDRNIRKRPGCRNNPNSSLLSFKTIWTDRDCRQSGNSEAAGTAVLVNNIVPDVRLKSNVSAPQMLNCWLWIPVHVVYWESSPMLLANTVCTLQLNSPNPFIIIWDYFYRTSLHFNLIFILLILPLHQWHIFNNNILNSSNIISLLGLIVLLNWNWIDLFW